MSDALGSGVPCGDGGTLYYDIERVIPGPQSPSNGIVFPETWGGCGDPPSQPVDTSEDAADSIKVVAGSIRAKALIWIMSRGSAGSTVDEAEAALDMRHQTISARFYELEYARCLVRGEDTRVTRSGRKARVYRITPLGKIRATMAMEGYSR